MGTQPPLASLLLATWANSRGSADPRESLRKRRISKIPLSAHTVLPAGAKQGAAAVR